MKSKTILMNVPFLMRKPFLYSLLCISFLATSCSAQTTQDEGITQPVKTISTIEEPSSDEIIAENMDPVDVKDAVVEPVENDNDVSEPTEPNSTSNAEAPKTTQTPKTTTAKKGGITSNNPSNNPIVEEPKTTEVIPTKDPSNFGIVGGNQGTADIDPKPAKLTMSHDIFDQLLRTHVSSTGAVDYNGLAKSKSRLNEYLSMLQNNAPDKSWSKNKEMAYWINMYNAFTISFVLEKYPINSIMDLEGGKVWDKKKIKVGSEVLTLNIIEKEKLLKRFKEPRVHFAVNCAAYSCPPLLNKAWTEDNVQRYLSKRATLFINNATHNTLGEKSIEISQIFNWYAGDFGGSEKVLPFIQKYSETEIKATAKVKFKEYQWKLNKK